MKKAMVLKDQNYDFLGIFLSSLCGVHCLMTPFLLLYFPSIGKNFESPWIHALLMGLVGGLFISLSTYTIKFIGQKQL